MARKKKLTKAQIKAKAAAAAKRMTMGKVNKMLAASGGAIDSVLVAAEDGSWDQTPRRVIQNYSGVNINNGTFDMAHTARGLGGPVFNKIERAIFKGLNVPAPSLKRKGFKSKVGVAVYYGASIANAMGGRDNLHKFRRYYHSQYGVDLNRHDITALDYSKPIVEKIIPYVLVTKAMQWAIK